MTEHNLVSNERPAAPALREAVRAARAATPMGLPLTVELVPRTSWFASLRVFLEPSEWDAVRVASHEAAQRRCEICGFGDGKLYALEVWEYNDIALTQTLLRVVSLCSPCYGVKTISAEVDAARGEAALRHLATVNGWSLGDTRQHLVDAVRLWSTRSEATWSLDLSVLGITVTDERIARAMERFHSSEMASTSWPSHAAQASDTEVSPTLSSVTVDTDTAANQTVDYEQGVTVAVSCDDDEASRPELTEAPVDEPNTPLATADAGGAADSALSQTTDGEDDFAFDDDPAFDEIDYEDDDNAFDFEESEPRRLGLGLKLPRPRGRRRRGIVIGAAAVVVVLLIVVGALAMASRRRAPASAATDATTSAKTVSVASVCTDLHSIEAIPLRGATGGAVTAPLGRDIAVLAYLARINQLDPTARNASEAATNARTVLGRVGDDPGRTVGAQRTKLVADAQLLTKAVVTLGQWAGHACK